MTRNLQQALVLCLIVVVVHGEVFQLSSTSFPPIKFRRRNVLFLRGGASSSSSLTTKTPSSDPPSLSSITTAASELVGSVWGWSESLLAQQIVPTLHGLLWIPIQTVAHERKSAAAAKVSPPRTTVIQSDEPNATRSPPQKQQQQRRRRRDTVVKKAAVSETQSTVDVPSSPLTLVLLPSRLIRLSLTAWILAEVLDRTGILHQETPKLLRSQFLGFWYDVQPHLSRWQQQIQQLWEQVTPDSLQSMIPTKYQFALGAGLGMVSAPLLAVATGALWQPALVLYGLAELNARAKRKGHWNAQELFPDGEYQSMWGVRTDGLLEGIRQSVRNVFPEPPTASQQLLLGTVGGVATKPLASNYSLGISGYVAPAPNLQDRLKHIGNQLVESSKQSLVEIREIIEAENKEEENPVIVMVRHGFMVGGMLGFLAGV